MPQPLPSRALEDDATVGTAAATRHGAGGRSDQSRLRHRWIWGLVLAAYTGLVVVVLLWPSPVDDGARDGIGDTLALLYSWGLPTWVDYDVIESAANVAMFVPLGVLVTRLTASPWWGLAAPVALSCAAELAQHLVRPERFATWADVAANTAGTALGVLAAMVGPALLRGRGTPASTPSRRRRARSRRPARSAAR